MLYHTLWCDISNAFHFTLIGTPICFLLLISLPAFDLYRQWTSLEIHAKIIILFCFIILMLCNISLHIICKLVFTFLFLINIFKIPAKYFLLAHLRGYFLGCLFHKMHSWSLLANYFINFYLLCFWRFFVIVWHSLASGFKNMTFHHTRRLFWCNTRAMLLTILSRYISQCV